MQCITSLKVHHFAIKSPNRPITLVLNPTERFCPIQTKRTIKTSNNFKRNKTFMSEILKKIKCHNRTKDSKE